MNRKNNNSSASSVNLERSGDKISINYYFTIVVLVVVMVNLILMIYCKPL